MKGLARSALGLLLLLAQSQAFAVAVLGTDMTLVGSATVNGSSLQLTPATASQGGAAWRTAQVSTSTSFTSTFSFSISGMPVHADGLSFAMQNVGPTAIGSIGGSLGVNGISNQVNLSIRTFYNNQVGFGNNTFGVKAAPSAMGNCGSVVGTMTVAYNLPTTTLSLSGSYVACGTTYAVSDTLVLNLASKFGASMYVGFTGATGGSVATHTITSWTFTTPQPSYYPSGPQSNVSLATITSGGWTQCYSSTMATFIGYSGESVTNVCKGDYLMMAGRATGSTTFISLAATTYAHATTNTGTNSNSITSNGSKWWYSPNWSWGFVAPADTIANSQCNTASGTKGMCLHTLAGAGGYRIDNTMGLNGSTAYEKVFFVSNGLPKLDHLEITANSSSGVTCAPTTYTIKACSDAACATPYTGGMTGTLTLTGTGVSTVFPAGAGFTIASGASTTTIVGQVTSVSTATVGATGLSLTPANAKPVFCGLGAAANSTNACTMTVAEAGFVTAVNAHYAGVDQTLSIQAVKKSDVTSVCVPAFANVTRSVRASCAYLNPTSGTRAPTLTAASVAYALNAANNANSACDATGRTVPLAFNASGVATAVLRYWDAGSTRLNLSYSGSVGTGDAGLAMAGEASYTTAPAHFSISGLPGNAVVAGTSFNMTVTAQSQGTPGTLVTLPNFGLETPAPALQLSFVRTGPTGATAVSGSFSVGTVGSFSGGVASVNGMSYSEVGTIRPTATLSNYLGSGLNVLGNGPGFGYHWVCAAAGADCVLPAGVSGAVSAWVGAGQLAQKLNVSGTVNCGSGLLGSAPTSACYFRPMSGVSADSGTVTLKPHRLEVSTTPACGSFSYAGQPFGATVTAKNALGAVTQNYDGTANTSPNFAKAVSFSDGTANASGSLTGSVAASAFSQGVATLNAATVNAPVYSFANKLTAPQTIGLRATDTDGLSSNGYDGSMTLRSGRLQMSNAFGGDKTSLQIPLQLQYWSGKSWVKNSDDTCTVIPAASVVRAQTLNHNNTAASWSSAISSITLSGGSGNITLGAPSPSGTGTVDLSINLGATTTDVSCLANHPSSTGAGLPWLRSRQGSCASSFDRDPSARGTFGVYAPETLRSVHVREVF